MRLAKIPTMTGNELEGNGPDGSIVIANEGKEENLDKENSMISARLLTVIKDTSDFALVCNLQLIGPGKTYEKSRIDIIFS